MTSALKNSYENTAGVNRIPPAGTIRTREPPRAGKKHGNFMKTRRKRSQTTRFLMKLGLITVVSLIVLIFVSDVSVQHGNRMYPFLMDGDVLITYKLGGYQEGDVVVYRNPETGIKEVSRIAAAGQNEILITEEGQLLINRFVPDGQVFYPTQPLEGSEIRYPYRMEEGSCFLLDDFRTQGIDSRWFGEIPEDELLGKIVYVFRRRGI